MGVGWGKVAVERNCARCAANDYESTKDNSARRAGFMNRHFYNNVIPSGLNADYVNESSSKQITLKPALAPIQIHN
jgi:hypothetical protein